MHQVDQALLKQELSTALSQYTQLLRNVNHIADTDMPAFSFTMRSFGFIFERLPGILIDDNLEETYFGSFQYYNLLAELKQNLLMNFPYAKLDQQNFSELLKAFPTTYQKEVNEWWENKTGLQVEFTKQTIRQHT